LGSKAAGRAPGNKLSGDAGALTATEDEGLSAVFGGVIDLRPETDEVVDRGDGGDQHREVDGGDGDPQDGDDDDAKLPLIPLMGQDGGDDGDDLGDGFQLAQVAGLNGESLRGGNRTKAGDEELAADDHDGDPDFDDLRVVGDQGDERASNHDFVGDRVEEHAEGGYLGALACQITVKPIGDRGQDEEDGGQLLLLAVRLPGKVRRQDPEQQGDHGDPAHRDGVGQIHCKPFVFIITSVQGPRCGTNCGKFAEQDNMGRMAA
jgi:hypothetical protein